MRRISLGGLAEKTKAMRAERDRLRKELERLQRIKAANDTIKVIDPPDTGDRMIYDGSKRRKKSGMIMPGLANV